MFWIQLQILIKACFASLSLISHKKSLIGRAASDQFLHMAMICSRHENFLFWSLFFALVLPYPLWFFSIFASWKNRNNFSMNNMHPIKLNSLHVERLDLLRHFAEIEFGVDPQHKDYQFINDFFRHGKFPLLMQCIMWFAALHILIYREDSKT